MCLIALAFNPGKSRHLLLVANRDEFHERPTRPMAWWQWPDGLLAGRDERAGGTWLAVSRNGRFAAVTNIRDPKAEAGRRSRGRLPFEYFQTDSDPESYVRRVYEQRAETGPFNLLAGDRSQLWHCSSQVSPCRIEPGVHALSNGRLDDPWPKSRRVARALSGLLDSPAEPDAERLFDLMNDRQPAPDEELPDTGIGLAVERVLSPPFIVTPHYGTRCTTLVSLGAHSRVVERRFGADGERTGEIEYRFQLL